MKRRAFIKGGGVLVVGVALGDWPLPAIAQPIPTADRFLGKSLDPKQVDSFLAIHADNTVTMFTGKVDIGTGGRIALQQMVAEELEFPIDRLVMIEGDTALTPDQARTAGSYGIARGGMQLRQAAATARQTLLGLAAQKLGRPVEELEVADGVIRAKSGGASVRYGELIGDKAFGVAVDAKAQLKNPQSFRFIGKSLPRPDVPAKVDVHYKHDETIVAMGMEVQVERASGRIRVTRVVCAQDCGLMINPDSVKSQVEGNILQTLSRALHEDVVFDRQRVTSVDWASYPILTFPEAPALEVELIQRLNDPPLGAGRRRRPPCPPR